jgi:hypothetical protein
MTYKEQILNSLTQEIRICQRLYTLLPPGILDYKPQEGMRTALELLQYLTFCGSYSIEAHVTDDPEQRKINIDKNYDYAETMQPEDFLKRMDEQIERINSYLKDVTDEELLTKEVELPWRVKKTMGEAILEVSLKWLTGYKMQLFLYAKMNGAKLDTGDCWIIPYGEDE